MVYNGKCTFCKADGYWKNGAGRADEFYFECRGCGAKGWHDDIEGTRWQRTIGFLPSSNTGVKSTVGGQQ